MTASILLVLPLVLPLGTAAASLLTWRSRRNQRWLGLAGALGLFAAGVALFVTVLRDGPLVMQAGGWPAPFGITLVADLFSALLVLVAGVMGLAIVMYARRSLDVRHEVFSFYPLVLILLVGVCGAFLTGDIFNLYVWFEVLLIASFVLLTLGGERAQLEGGVKYVTLNLLSSALFLAAVGILYGLVGTLNMADIATRLGSVEAPGLVTTVATLFLIAFGIKAAYFPLFFWLPASYPTPPPVVSALFAGLLTKVGVYATIRVFTLFFVHDPAYTSPLLLTVAALTMLVGALGAVSQRSVRRILSFLIVSHIGFAVMGLAIGTPLALTGTIYYLVEDIVVLTNLFLLSGVIEHLAGSGRLSRIGGLYRRAPIVAALFLIPALSLSGVPPLAGFFAKVVLLRSALETGHFGIVAAALVASILTMLAMMRIWLDAFWRPAPAEETAASTEAEHHPLAPIHPPRWTVLLPSALLGAVSIALGLGAEGIVGVASTAAAQLLAPEGYVRLVLGGGP